MGVLVLCKKRKKTSYLESIHELKIKFPGRAITIIGENFEDEVAGANTRIKVISVNDSAESMLAAVESVFFREVVLLGYEHNDKLQVSLLVACLTKEIESIRLFIDGKFIRYAPFNNKKSKTLIVFPGSILPLNMGSHQRAFHLLLHLNYMGSYTDVIITGGGKNLTKYAGLLMSICPEVYIYKNNKRKISGVLKYRRIAEKFYRSLVGLHGNVPELFIDRLSNKATFSLKKMMLKLLEEKKYKNVIVSYAWMANCKSLLTREQYSKVNWYCDTHDVQYIRNSSANKHQRRFLAFEKFDALKEKKILSEFDKVLAISDSDYEELTKVMDRKVIKVSSSFAYAFRPVRTIVEGRSINFGFIGGGMEANVKSLEFILENWWPLIKQFSPRSKIFIAGSICNVKKIVNLVMFDESIKLLGFVDVISDFYNKIDISLNPALVQGGLNFKSVEAVVSGKLLITNSMGVKCLGKSNIATVVDNNNSIIDIIREYETHPDKYKDIVSLRQKMALDYFGCDSAYSELVRCLDA